MWQGSVQLAGDVIERELRPGEKLLWSGKPRDGLRLRSSDAALIPASLAWGGFAIFWEVSVFATRAPFFFKLWGIPLVLTGLYRIFGRFLVDAKAREQTFYGVTNERVIIVTRLFGLKVQSFPLQTLPQLTLEEKADGSGTLLLAAPIPNKMLLSGNWPNRQNQMPPAFEMIEYVRHVQGIIQDAQQSALRAQTS